MRYLYILLSSFSLPPVLLLSDFGQITANLLRSETLTFPPELLLESDHIFKNLTPSLFPSLLARFPAIILPDPRQDAQNFLSLIGAACRFRKIENTKFLLTQRHGKQFDQVQVLGLHVAASTGPHLHSSSDSSQVTMTFTI